MTQDRPVTLAAIIGAHGVMGEVRLKLFSESPESLKAHKSFDASGRTLTLKNIRPGQNGAIARFAEIADRNAAEALRGTQLTVPRSSLPPLGEGEYYYADLLGLPCVSTTGEELGTVAAVENFGAGDIIEIERPDGKRFMVPMRPEAVPEWGEKVVVDATFVQ
ncbi:MAG: 16S rRNA processing protein RimM [Alphaproteobacteria bacterium]|nr:16S rRNA processing protein RimM [Alphaproteobacteria bacterium]